MNGIKGKRTVTRVKEELVTDTFVTDLKLTGTMKIIIELVYKMKVLKVSQIKEITGCHIRTIRDSVKMLNINRILCRQFPPALRSEQGSHEGYVMLDKGGKIFIAGLYDIPLKDVKFNIRELLVHSSSLEHNFMINDTRISFEKFARKTDYKVIDAVCDKHLYYQFANGAHKLRPDMILKYSDGISTKNYFFEIDRSTEAIMAVSRKTTGFNRKIIEYEEFCKSREYEDYGLEEFPTVIVVTKDKDRVMKLLETVKNIQHINVFFTTIDMLSKGLNGKIFVKLEENNGVKSPKSISLFEERS